MIPAWLAEVLCFLTVKAVVHAVNHVLRLRLEHHEARLVLLDHFLFLVGQARDVVHVAHRLQRLFVGGNLARRARVHAAQPQVGSDVGVVEVDLIAAAQVLDAIVVHVSIGSQRQSHGRSGRDLPHEVTAFLQRERGKSKYYEYSEAIKSSAYI